MSMNFGLTAENIVGDKKTIGDVRESFLNRPATLGNLAMASFIPLVSFLLVVITFIMVIYLVSLTAAKEGMCTKLMRFGNPLQEADNLGQARVDQASMGGPVQVYC